ncbi:MAG: transcription termination factor Rho [Intrasporangium sp.]|uniref:transcription termination factor Rho n=1 Tax=Intrasporangium sp. TaxID=1925024 RepID=UPI002647513C|nr:transcription termination factor Rho [Intrasporangium sp.]MDN5796166.1 transcription termination factor Rho [Intrasporangium sp.]
MKLDELKSVASSMGIKGTAKMRKSDLVAAIRDHQSGGSSEPAPRTPRRATRQAGGTVTPEVSGSQVTDRADAPADERAGAQPGRGAATAPQPQSGDRARDDRDRQERSESRGATDQRGADRRGEDDRKNGSDRSQQDGGDRHGEDNGEDRSDRTQPGQGNRQGQVRQQAANREDDDRGARRGRNRNRNRDRKRRAQGGQDWNEAEPQINEDDVIVPVAGILDVLDNYAFVRTTGYLPGPNDVYVSIGMVKRHGLRKGDAITGAVKALRDGEQPSGHVGRQKYNALVRLDTVNGTSAEDALKRVEFHTLIPLYPQQRLRLETEPQALTTRVIDLIAPIGKGQRGLIVAPAKAGKTMVMQAMANAITTNNPECHLMVVLVDERPEEVTEMQRAVKGEVISSTFDRPAEDHTTVAELSIERAKRLVELGHDVVVLLDSITKLGRAYNLAAPASGRILSGGVDSAALYPPKKFFGAARNIENGGSLTILATALVETGSKMDEVIFEEFKGTGNMELRLSRELANRRIFPAVDVNASGTRREEILLASEELKIMWKLRRVLGALEATQAIELLLDRLKKTRTNYEFLMQVQHSSSIHAEDQA